MKILLIHDYGTATGGAEFQVLSLQRGLQERGHDVRLFSSQAVPVEGYPLLADYTCFGTNSKFQVLSETLNWSAYQELRWVLKDFQPDVVHIRMFLWQISPLILPLLKRFPCLYQTAVYKAICPLGTNLLPDGRPCRVSPGLSCLSNGCLTPQSWVVLLLQHQLWQRWRSSIDQIVALSYAMKKELEQAGLYPVEVIYNGVPVRSRRPTLSSPPTVAYAGRLVPEKGVDVLLQAFAIAKNRLVESASPKPRLMIAGQGSAEAKLHLLAEKLGIASDIVWLGHLTRDELENKFEAAWVQVVPSLWAEPFGNVTTEAMMRGTAVIASAIGAQSEIVVSEETGFLVPPGDINALATSLVTVFRSPPLAEAMGQVGRVRALKHFSEDSLIGKFEELYQRLKLQYTSNAP